MDIYGTHLPALMAAVERTNGPIVEFGCGYYSTLVLHEFCRQSKRRLVSAETDMEWLNKFINLRDDYSWHEFYHVTDWDVFQRDIIRTSSVLWGVAFVDHKPGERRAVDIQLLRQHARLIVVHDTETDFGTGADYKYEPEFQRFAFRTDYKRVRPYTTVVSDFEKLELNQTFWKSLEDQK